MGENIISKIKGIKIDKRQSEETKIQATKLEKIIGTNEPVPEKLAKEILSNESKGDAVDIMKTYVENKNK